MVFAEGFPKSVHFKSSLKWVYFNFSKQENFKRAFLNKVKLWFSEIKSDCHSNHSMIRTKNSFPSLDASYNKEHDKIELKVLTNK